MNLLSKLHRNSILTGAVESYCLVCCCLLHSEEDAYAHIHEPTHMAKLDAVPQLANYNDCIIQCESGYFCHYCNKILPTLLKVKLHVSGLAHKENRNSQFITRQAGTIIAFDAVIISERAWNGLDGTTCSICNEDYDDEEEHRKDTSHVLKLIQSTCLVGDTYIYRKVDAEFFFCLICNEILHIFDQAIHHESEKHLTHFEKSKFVNTNTQTQAVIETNNNTLKLPVNEDKHDKTLSKVAHDIKPKAVQNKDHNGGAHDINNAGHSTEGNIQTATLHVNEIKEDQTKISPPIKINETKEGKATNDACSVRSEKETNFYNILKANNFIINITKDGSAACVVCDIRIPEADITSHIQAPHHNILLAKVIARINRNTVNGYSKEITVTEDKPKTNIVNQAAVKQANKSYIKESENKDTKETKTNTITTTTLEINKNNKRDKCIEIKTDIIVPVNEENKKNKANKKHGIHETATNLQNKENNKPETVASNGSSKKRNKKAQKKAAKARAKTEPIHGNISKTDSPIAENKGYEPDKDITDENGVGNTTTNETEDNPKTKLDKPSNIIDNIDTHKKNNSHAKEKIIEEFKTERLLNLLETVSHVENQDDVVINGKYVLGHLSFVLVVESEDKLKCVACDQLLKEGIVKHIITDEHRSSFEECCVVMLDDEFIRQLKSKELHCGYCNMVLPSWNEMKGHVKSYQHSEVKLSAKWRLVRYQPHLKNCEIRKVSSMLEAIFRSIKE